MKNKFAEQSFHQSWKHPLAHSFHDCIGLCNWSASVMTVWHTCPHPDPSFFQTSDDIYISTIWSSCRFLLFVSMFDVRECILSLYGARSVFFSMLGEQIQVMEAFWVFLFFLLILVKCFHWLLCLYSQSKINSVLVTLTFFYLSCQR